MKLPKLAMVIMSALFLGSFSGQAHEDINNASCTLKYGNQTVTESINIPGQGLSKALPGAFTFDGSVWPTSADNYAVGLTVSLDANPHFGSYKEITVSHLPFSVSLYSDETGALYTFSCK